MNLFKQTKPRYTVERNENSATITIESRRSIFHLAFYGLFIVIWFYVLAGMGIFWGTLSLFLISPAKNTSTAQIFMTTLFIFLTFTQLFHAYLGGKAVYLILREWTGKEIIEIDKSKFEIVWQILDWRKTKTFTVQKIKELQIIKKPSPFAFVPPWRKRFYEEKISFNDEEKTYRFGFWLKEKEASEILPIIQKALDEARS